MNSNRGNNPPVNARLVILWSMRDAFQALKRIPLSTQWQRSTNGRTAHYCCEGGTPYLYAGSLS
jgi:hypothetical protein